MKKIFTILLAVLLTANVFFTSESSAQSPQKMSYQAVIRNASSNLVSTQNIGIKISILKSSTTGTTVYVETQTPTTNANGLVTIEIGTGITTDDFSTIDWSNGTYYIKTETDPEGGTNYTITGTSQLLSVPYALHAKTAENISGGISETDPLFASSQANNITATDITNLGNLSGTNTGDQNINGIAINTQAIQDTASQIRADFSISSAETDPVYSAWNKSYNDLTNTPNIIDSVTTVIDTTTQFIRTETDPVFTNWDKDYVDLTNKPDLNIYATKDMGNANITNLATPVNDNDAVTKAYVDVLEARITILEGVEDYDGNKYKVTIIGNQVWMAENLKSTHYPDGTEISTVSDTNGNGSTNDEWTALADNDTDEAYCYYNNNTSNEKDTYGALYTYAAANDACPTDWHLPSDAEWTELVDYITNDGHSATEGTALRSVSGWNIGIVGTNDYSFTALPGGYRSQNLGTFNKLLTDGDWWSATESSSTMASGRFMGYNNANVVSTNNNKSYGLSVRCIKD